MIGEIILQYPTLHKRSVGAIVFIALLSLAPGVNAQLQKLDEVTGEVAITINRNDNPEVRVLDFENMHQRLPELGARLADQFSDSLRAQARGFVLDRTSNATTKYVSSTTVSNDLSDTHDCDTATKSYANATIEGYFDVLSDSDVSLWVTVFLHQKSIFEKRFTLTLTPELRALALKPTPRSKNSPGPIVWTSSDRPHDNFEDVVRLPDSSDPRFRLPTCLECSNPQYSDAATVAKVQGTVKFDVEIDADGFPVQIVLIQSLRCGLTSKAIDAVAHWKFAPATGPDKRALAVVVPIEVTFRLY